MKAKMELNDALEILHAEERTRTGRKIHVKWTLAAEKAAIPGEYIVTYHYWWNDEEWSVFSGFATFTYIETWIIRGYNAWDSCYLDKYPLEVSSGKLESGRRVDVIAYIPMFKPYSNRLDKLKKEVKKLKKQYGLE